VARSYQWRSVGQTTLQIVVKNPKQPVGEEQPVFANIEILFQGFDRLKTGIGRSLCGKTAVMFGPLRHAACVQSHPATRSNVGTAVTGQSMQNVRLKRP
jgi:hypothetical protein